mmetsp:Transcript_6390/g.26872  ORF Transcript_6390/g.26872 Transcript_6390/m.26872 type:complete len:411 (-) Transcript_6390:571-1803(-)
MLLLIKRPQARARMFFIPHVPCARSSQARAGEGVDARREPEAVRRRHAQARRAARGARARPDPPEPERLVAGARDERLAVGRGREVQDALRVADQRRRVGDAAMPVEAPDADVVERVAVRRREAPLLRGRPRERAHLGARVDRVDVLARDGVPELDRAVRRAGARREEPAAVRTPRDRLDGRDVLGELARGHVLPGVRQACAGAAAAATRRRRCRRRSARAQSRPRVPDEELVVVAARGEQVAARRPTQPADLLPVRGGDPRTRRPRRRRRFADVAHADGPVARARGEDVVAAPRQTPDARRVRPGVVVAKDALLGEGVPDRDAAGAQPDGEVRAAGGPRDGTHRIARAEVAQFGRVRRAARPQQHARAEADGEDVARRPRDEVEIKVVGEAGGLEHLERRRRDRRAARC